jgi:ferric-dicitrate binding protein FerR (iron transport regulator)
MNDEDDTIAKLVQLAGRRPAVDPERMNRVRESVHAEWQQVARKRKRTRVILGAIAVAAMISIALFLIPARETKPALILETKGEFKTHHWNGATLRLDANSRVIIESNDRAVLERGAIFYSSDQRKDTIIIDTVLGEIKDVGTQFEVRVENEAVRVRVREGVVEMRNRTASAGEEIVATDTDTTIRKVPTHGETWSWIERAAPPLVLEGQTLEAVVERVAREKGLRVEWNVTARKVVLHGDVPLSLDEALDAATAAAGVTYRIDDGTLTVTR